MFISEFLSNANFGFALFTILLYSMISYNDRIDCFTTSDWDRSDWFETVLQYPFQSGKNWPQKKYLTRFDWSQSLAYTLIMKLQGCNNGQQFCTTSQCHPISGSHHLRPEHERWHLDGRIHESSLQLFQDN